jgi:hypothetical protein
MCIQRALPVPLDLALRFARLEGCPVDVTEACIEKRDHRLSKYLALPPSIVAAAGEQEGETRKNSS